MTIIHLGALRLDSEERVGSAPVTVTVRGAVGYLGHRPIRGNVNVTVDEWQSLIQLSQQLQLAEQQRERDAAEIRRLDAALAEARAPVEAQRDLLCEALDFLECATGQEVADDLKRRITAHLWPAPSDEMLKPFRDALAKEHDQGE